MTCCLNAEQRMTDSCSRRKMSFCKLKFNNVNIILSLTWKPNWCFSVSFGVWLPLVPYKKHFNRGWLDQIIVIRRLFNYRDRPNVTSWLIFLNVYTMLGFQNISPFIQRVRLFFLFKQSHIFISPDPSNSFCRSFWM